MTQAAFPSVCLGDSGHPASEPGMDIRDYFAAAIMPAAMFRSNGDRHTVTEAANVAYRYADAMLAERRKHP